jgi:predicted RNA-binding Zn-ribbon protein involved in translation (DUF1610 family)
MSQTIAVYEFQNNNNMEKKVLSRIETVCKSQLNARNKIAAIIGNTCGSIHIWCCEVARHGTSSL